MKKSRQIFLSLMLAAASVMPVLAMTQASAATSEDLNVDARAALDKLYRINPTAAVIGRKAKAILVFPNIVKAGLIFGGAYGEGELLKGPEIAGYYNSVTASWGFQAGVQSYGYVVFLMSNKAASYLNRSDGWEIGVGPTVVVVDEGVARNLSSSTLKDDAYAFIFSQEGLMAGISIEGTKITHIHPNK
jgi:lipid-binding SYLF domain-containing protein